MSNHEPATRAARNQAATPAPGGGRPRLPERSRWIWLVAWVSVLSTPVHAAWLRHDTGGYVGLAAICVAGATAAWCTVLGIRSLRSRRPLATRRWWVLFAVSTLATGVAIALLGIEGCQLLPFLLVALALTFRWQVVAAVALPLGALFWFSSWWYPSWGNNHGMALGMVASAAGAALGRFATERNAVATAMTEHAHQLEISEERNRMARDLHDILGHSLTVIAMKSELAGKLVDRDPEAARAELAEVQSLARSALADVRSTVNGYREMSLAGEIARAASTLRSAGVKADLPATVDVVDPELRELFAWTLREAVTNVVRHAAAAHCRVTLTASGIEVADDGRGIRGSSDGHGLEGLRQRCQAAGATLRVAPGLHGRGTALLVEGVGAGLADEHDADDATTSATPRENR